MEQPARTTQDGFDFRTEINPCEQHVVHVGDVADQSASGPVRWYMRWHMLSCPRCRHAVEQLRILLRGLRQLDSGAFRTGLSPARRASIAKALESIDRAAHGG